jgi:hypothetical protein
MTILFIVCTTHYATNIFSQEIPVSTEQQLENLTDADQGETEDDTYLQELEQFRRNPINLNNADADELKQLKEELSVSKEKVTTMMKDMVAEFNETIEPKTAEKKKK